MVSTRFVLVITVWSYWCLPNFLMCLPTSFHHLLYPMASHNCNPVGKNQQGIYMSIIRHLVKAGLPPYAPKADSKEFTAIMKVYHCKKILSNLQISKKLFADHGVMV